MPKLIDYPRTPYAGAWELAEIVDDTGGKCAIETAARKLNRKVSGSFKAIIGSAVKFGLLTSKRDLLTTTTLFKRIKHAYDKQEELVFHREAFLTPPLFTQLCRKFRSRELPVQMLDVMLIREFSVEEINAPGVAKAFVEGCRMVGLLDEHNIIADIDALAAKQPPRREMASPQPPANTFRSDNIFQSNEGTSANIAADPPAYTDSGHSQSTLSNGQPEEDVFAIASSTSQGRVITPPNASRDGNTDAIASLFGLLNTSSDRQDEPQRGNTRPDADSYHPTQSIPSSEPTVATAPRVQQPVVLQASPATMSNGYQIQVSGPGINTTLSITEEEDIALAIALLEKIRRQLKA